MLLNILAVSFFVAGLIAFYFIVIRPAITSYAFVSLRAEGESVWKALAGFRTKIATWALMIPSGLVGLYDTIAPMAAGIDWTPVTAKVPAVAWPFILLAIGAIFHYLRKITEGPEAHS